LTQPPAVEQMTELGCRRWRVLILCSVGMFMGTLLATIVAVALPVLSPALRLTYSEALWVQAAYLLTMSVFLIPVGRLADQRGLMRFYLFGLCIFGIFSVACSLAFNGASLIVARCLQGSGSAFTSATSVALVTTAFPAKDRGKALGLNAMAGYVGLMLGPPIGGLIVDHTSWRWIFLINVPLVIITIVGSWLLLDAEERDREKARAGSSVGHVARFGVSLDWPGTALLALTLVALLVPLIFVPFWGWQSLPTLGLLGGFVILLAVFILVENRVQDPVLDLDLLRKNRLFAAGNAAAFLSYAAVFGITTLTAVFLEIVEGYSAQRAGLLLLAQPVFMASLSPVFGRISDRIGSRLPATGGMLLVAAGTALLGTLPASAAAWRVALALAVVGIGMAAFSAPNTSSIMGSVQRSQLSLASGFLSTMRTAGQGFSIALLGAIAASGLGPVGGRVLFLGEQASGAAALSFSDGYRTAMLVAAGLAVAGALASLQRGARTR
jgi:EmrB/QacA subfamily drug resistance transporter